MADRSINDLTQYPVFPWVVADYTSDTLGKFLYRYQNWSYKMEQKSSFTSILWYIIGCSHLFVVPLLLSFNP